MIDEKELEALLIAYFVYEGLPFKIEHWSGCFRITVGDGPDAKEFCVNDWELPTQQRLKLLMET